MSVLLKEAAALAASVDSFAAMKLESLSEFPEEILLQVFGHLSAEDLVHVSQVSTRWKYASSSDDLWQRLCNRKWHSSECASLSLLSPEIVPPVLEGNVTSEIEIVEQSIEPQTSQSGEETVLASQTKETTGQGEKTGQTSGDGVLEIESASASSPPVVLPLEDGDRKVVESDGGKMKRVMWKEVYRQRLEFEAEARMLVDDMVWPLLRPRSLQRLVELRSLVAEELERLAEKDDALSEGTRYFALEALYRVHRQTCVDGVKRFLALTQQEMEDQIASGALIIARLRYRNLDVDSIEKKLDDIATFLRRRIDSDPDIANHGGVHTPAGRLAAVKQLNYLLFGRGNEENEGADPDCLHLEGNRENYYSPRNSYLNDVLESRRGIPISLATVHASVGRKCGIPIQMVGIPMHFLTKVGEPEENDERFIDVFDGGHLLLRDECVELVRSTGLPFHPQQLNPVTTPQVLVRMCNNLLAIYGQAERS